MRTDLFDYELPPELIAQEPVARRDESRLMVLDRVDGTTEHRLFRELPDYLGKGDCLMINRSRVYPGRLKARKVPTGGRVELLLLERLKNGRWVAIAGGARLRPGVLLEIGGPDLCAEVTRGPDCGRVELQFRSGSVGEEGIDGYVFARGEVPLPPYIHRKPPDMERYQTVFGEREISAAAPTAGLHFTRGLLRRLREMGVVIAGLELAVGLDTFSPVREEQVEQHLMHTEWYAIDEECASRVNLARDAGGKAVAVGTTVVRATETVATSDGRLVPGTGRTGLFITPGYDFKAVDALITNLHFPRSTLLMLVCAFAGYDSVMAAYREAVRMRYRFYSFGDAMLIL